MGAANIQSHSAALPAGKFSFGQNFRLTVAVANEEMECGIG
jgi:hypothetical protein